LVGQGVEFRLGNGTHIVGRDAGAEIRLDSAKVSRQHARVVVSGADLTIEDLGSTNGTFVGGELINGVTVLHHGNQVHVGPVALTVDIHNRFSDDDTEAWDRETH